MKLEFFILIVFSISSLKSEFIDYKEIDKQISIITINRQKALNALNSQVLEELDKTFDTIDTTKIRAVIITGAGEKAFVAGADITEMSTLSKKEGEAFSKKGNDVFRKIETFEIPVIAAVNGYALGGGCEIAMSCDIRICSANALFGQPEVGLGITPGFGGTQRLARLIGIGMAKQMIFTGQNINAEEAKRIGLVNEVYPKEELLNEAIKLAKAIAKNSGNAVKSSKKAINEGLQLDIDSAIQLEEEIFGECFETKDQVELMKAFLSKNKKPKEKKKEKKEEVKEEDNKKLKTNLRQPNPETQKGDLISIEDFKGMSFLKSFKAPNMPAILTAGNKEKHNSLIIGWGLLGAAWQRPLFLVYVHPDRYTFQFMKTTEYFTVSFIKKELYKKFVPYGNKSGRDINKEEVAGTHIQYLDNGGITFEEAEEFYVCKMMGKAYFKKEDLHPEIIDFYDKGKKTFKQSDEPHGLFIGEIIGHYKR